MVTTKRKTLDAYIEEQRQWIARCGGNLLGYTLNYGSKDDPNHSGDGAEAIYAADRGELDRLLALRAAGRKYL